MKEFINKIKNMDKTKRIVILFITISFVFIGSFSIYNGVTGNYKTNQVLQVDTTKNKKEKNTKETKKEEKQETTDQTQETEPTQSDSQSSTQSTDETKTNDENKSNSKSSSTTQSNSKSSSAGHSQSSTNQSQSNSGQASNNQSNNSSNNSSSSQQPTNGKITVNMQVIGVDSTLMSGTLSLEKNTSVYSALKTLAAQKGVSVSTSGFGASTYVRGIGGLKEFDYGGNSGWLYMVNSIKPSYGAYSYKLNDGDTVKWYYTTDYTKE